ncbi:hypothetical protein MKW94_025102 [Papaver nudicaule]|uniref:E3 ubiquitin protein ligase n=1 Tax=Papaver nudicaule TaxID=74823 RepID=A0AA41VKK1_PAPNU|nr:hypothetical protein [Papaver nudicaule]
MGSTGEADRKRRHFSSISPTAVAKNNSSSLLPCSLDKKIDTGVLEYRNQKLFKELETQKVEYHARQSKYSQLKDRQEAYDDTLIVVDCSWNQLVNELESHSIHTRGSLSNGQVSKQSSTAGAISSPDDTFLSRLLETGATDSCSANSSPAETVVDNCSSSLATRCIIENIVATIEDLRKVKARVSTALSEKFSIDDPDIRKTSADLIAEVNNLREAFDINHLKHKSVSHEVQNHRDTDARNKAELKRLSGDLESTIRELEESNSQLATLKVQKDASRGLPIPVLNFGNKHVSVEKTRDKQKDIQDMECTLKELLELASSRLLEVQNLHEGRIQILKKLSGLQCTMKDLKYISSSKAYLLLNDQLEKSKDELIRCRSMWEKLQVEKDNFAWREADLTVKADAADISRRAASVADSWIRDLEKELHKQLDQRNMFEIKLEENSGEPGRK